MREALPKTVFVSYYHDEDQCFYHEFRDIFVEHSLVQDLSLQRPIKGRNAESIMSTIRDVHMSRAACTIVLCGRHTHERQYVDWEIKASLDLGHGLIGVQLPTNVGDGSDEFLMPCRLRDNIRSGYALAVRWVDLRSKPLHLHGLIDQAISQPKNLVRNGRPMLTHNGVEGYGQEASATR